MSRAYIGVGSNLDPERNVQAALAALRRALPVVAISTFYRTEPIGHPDDPEFVNGVIAVEAARSGPTLEREVLRPIEDALGRTRTGDRDGPRPIDLDLLVTELPDGSEAAPARQREIEARPFIAWALCELAPSLVLPDGRSIVAIAERLPRRGMVPLTAFTRRLREELHGE